MAGRWVCWFVGLLVPFAWILPCTAQEHATPPVSVHQEELASLRRIPELYMDERSVPASTTILTAQEIERSGASTIQELLSRAEGVMWTDQQGFGLGSDGTLNLRGVVNSSRTNALVLVDGIRQNRITGDEVHWQSIPVEQIERVEIVRGGGSLIYGEGALAGVINIITKKRGEKRLETEEGVERGSFGWQRYHVAARGHWQPLGYDVDYSRRLVEGYRESSASRNTTIGVHTSVEPIPLVSGTMNVLHSDDTTGFPGGLTQAQTDQRRRQTNAFHGFNHNTIDQVSLDLVGGPWEGLSGVVNLFWRRWVQTSEDSIAFNSFTVTPSRGLSVRTNSEWTSGAIHNLLVNGIELINDKATTGDRDAFPGPDSESNRNGYGLYAEDTLTLWDRASFIGGLRYDRSRYQESLTFPSFEGTLRFQGFSPKAGVTFTVVPETWHLFASYARPFKAPNVDDFSARVSNFHGNVDLKPQQADTYELGTKFSKAPINGQATWFYALTDHEILFNGLTSQNQNFDTRRVGCELSGRLESPDHGLRSYLTYTFVEPEFRKGAFAKHLVPGTPRHTLNAGVGFSPVESLWIDLNWQLVDDFFRINDMNNSLGKAKGYGVVNLVLTYELPKRLVARGCPKTKAYLKIENLTNEEYVTFQSSNGRNVGGAGQYPMPPTTFTGGVSVQF